MAIPVRPLAAVGFVWFLLGLFYYLFSSPTSAALSPAGLDEATTRPLPSTDAAASADYLEGALSLTPTTAVDSSDDPTLWRTFLQEPFVPREHRRLFAPVEILPDACLERWIAQGVPCSSEDLSEKDPKPLLDVDVVWTWVNGSDPRWAPLYTTHRNSTPASPEPPAARHYRSAKDELRHSVRSVMTYVFPRPRRLHLVLGDWQEGEEENTGAGNGESTTSIVLSRRRGQLPGWLALSLNDRTIIDEETGTEVVVHWHSNLFLGDGLRGEEAQRNYTRAALPTYNSFAIESNLYAIPGLSSSFAYFNDDFFLLRNHTRADFSSPIYGPVLRLSSPKSYLIPPFEFPAPGCEHEWNSLLRSSWLLSQRFPNKKRGYLQHIAKTLSQPLLLEARLIWEFQAVPSGTRRFRETSEGKLGDLNTAWLGSWLLVERARESLLWVWAVARLGGVDGLWGEEQRKEVREVLGMKDEDEGKNIKITKIKRDTVKTETIERAFQGLGEDGPRATKYLWSSLDGPLPGLEGGKPCTIAPVQCLGKWIEINSTEVISAEAMFKRIAFGGGGLCGDCILSAVIATSGTRGLSAILPPASAVAFAFPPAVKLGIKAQQKQFPHLERDLQPHMPLTPAWMTTDFSLASVVALVNPSDPHATVDLRTYALRLVARYQYTSAHTNALFSMIVNPTGFGGLVEQLETDPAIVSVGMNDDAEEQWAPALEPLVATYLGYRWPLKGWWERKGR